MLGEAKNLGDDLDGSFEKSLNIASVLTLTPTTNLSVLNGGDGVDTVLGQDDISITVSDGTTYNINLDSATTVQDVIDAIDTVTGGPGVVDISLNATSTGLIFDDKTSGSTTFSITALNSSDAAA